MSAKKSISQKRLYSQVFCHTEDRKLQIKLSNERIIELQQNLAEDEDEQHWRDFYFELIELHRSAILLLEEIENES